MVLETKAKNDGVLEVDFVIDPGSICTIIIQPTYLALLNVGQHLHLKIPSVFGKQILVHQLECLVTQQLNPNLKPSVKIQSHIECLLPKNRDRTQ